MGRRNSVATGFANYPGSLSGPEEDSMPSGLVSWIYAAHPEGLPTPPVLGASTMGRSTRRSLSISVVPPEKGTFCEFGPAVTGIPVISFGGFGDGRIFRISW